MRLGEKYRKKGRKEAHGRKICSRNSRYYLHCREEKGSVPELVQRSTHCLRHCRHLTSIAMRRLINIVIRESHYFRGKRFLNARGRNEILISSFSLPPLVLIECFRFEWPPTIGRGIYWVEYSKPEFNREFTDRKWRFWKIDPRNVDSCVK